MNDLMKVLQEADAAAVTVERSRLSFEAAKSALEKAKALLEEAQENLNQVFAKGEESGLSRSKLKKLTEERTTALMASGLMLDLEAPPPRGIKVPRKKSNGKNPADTSADLSAVEAFHEEPPSLELQ